MRAPADLPTGTVTFVFTDIEGSTRLVQALGDDFVEVLELHNDLVRSALGAESGVEIRNEGDAFFYVFSTAGEAAAAAAAAQRALHRAQWPPTVELRVRMGMHTGSGKLGGTDYVGLDVHRAARVAATGHGGQVVLSEPTAVLIEHTLPPGCSLRDLGKHRLKDLTEAETLFQLVVEDLPQEFPPLATLDVVPNNLPVQLTSFVGREDELELAAKLLGEARIVTLTGPGGTGKTRLALHTAAHLAQDFPDGVFFVALSPISDPALVPSAAAEAVGVVPGPNTTPEESLRQFLAQREALIVFDNFEHVLDAAGHVSDLARIAPNTKFLVTSRAPLRVYGEHELPVPPLDLSEVDPASPEELMQVESVRLFVERAVAVRPDFELTEDNGPTVAELLRRLDGLPLAVELVASRLRVLSPQGILDRLDPAKLGGGARDLPARQQTLWNTVAWSYDMLDEPQCKLFDRLAVLAGGARLEEIEAVCGPMEELGIDVLDGLAALLDHSLIGRIDGPGGDRYRMLHIIREFATAKLADRGEQDTLRDRHVAAYLALAEEIAPQLKAGHRKALLDLLGADHDNLRAALGWSIGQDDAAVAGRLCFALWRFWQHKGHLHEARQWLDRVLAAPGASDRTRAKVLEASGSVAWWQGDKERCRADYEECLRLWREIGDKAEIANALYNTAFPLAFMFDDHPAGRELLDEARLINEEIGNRVGLTETYRALGWLSAISGDMERAEELLSRAAEEAQAAGDDFGLANATYALADSQRLQGKFDDALRNYRRSLQMALDAGDLSSATLGLAAFAKVALDQGDHLRAYRLAGAAHALRKTTGADLMESDVTRFQGLEEETLEALEGDLYDAYAAGLAMDLAEAVEDAFGDDRR